MMVVAAVDGPPPGAGFQGNVGGRGGGAEQQGQGEPFYSIADEDEMPPSFSAGGVVLSKAVSAGWSLRR